MGFFDPRPAYCRPVKAATAARSRSPQPRPGIGYACLLSSPPGHCLQPALRCYTLLTRHACCLSDCRPCSKLALPTLVTTFTQDPRQLRPLCSAMAHGPSSRPSICTCSRSNPQTAIFTSRVLHPNVHPSCPRSKQQSAHHMLSTQNMPASVASSPPAPLRTRPRQPLQCISQGRPSSSASCR